MGIIASLLLAATLSSDSIGTFFDRPSWMPNTVSSVNTPGSDPSSGDGWYVDEIVATGYTEWSTTMDGDSVQIFLALGYRDPNKWTTVGCGHIPGTVTTLSFEWVDLGDPESTHLEWSWLVEVSTNLDCASVWRTYQCTADRQPTYGPSGRKVPRSPRLTPEVASGVNSTFEGYFERQYFAMQGQSNVWDTAQWGPRTGYKRFWFDPYRMLHPDDPGVYGDWEYSTNLPRTVATRRLVEYDRIGELSETILVDLVRGGMRLRGARRPGWIDSAEYSYYTDDCRCWWSSTEATVLDGTQIVPTMNWVSDPFANSIDWSKCSQVFLCLENDDVWNLDYGHLKEYKIYPTRMLMADLWFGQPVPTEYAWDKAAPDTIDGVTMGHHIETNYPHADGWAITNDTRRLFSDRLCCMNQLLGLMDRTYHVPKIDYPTETTNHWGYNRRIDSGYAPVSLSYDGTTGEISVDTIGSISWETSASSNWLEVASTNLASSGNAYHYRVSATATSVGVGVGPDPYGYLETGDIDDYVLQSALESASCPTGSYVVGYMRLTANRQLRIDASSGSGIIPLSFEVPSTNAFLYVGLSYTRQYWYMRTVGDAEVGPTQPGWQSTGRVKERKYGSVVGVHFRDDDPYDMAMLPWSSTLSVVEYKSSAGDYYSRDGLLSALADVIDSGRQRFAAKLEANPLSPAVYVPISGTDFNRVRSSIELSNGLATIRPLFSTIFFVGSWKGTGIDGLTFSYSNLKDEWQDGYPAKSYIIELSASETHDSPSQTELDPASADVKVGVITRVDWQWKTLKRTGD